MLFGNSKTNYLGAASFRSSAKSDGVCLLLRCDSFAQVIFCTQSIEDRPHLL